MLCRFDCDQSFDPKTIFKPMLDAKESTSQPVLTTNLQILRNHKPSPSVGCFEEMIDIVLCFLYDIPPSSLDLIQVFNY